MNGDRYVMFGVHGLFGDYVDVIHACGGTLERVVLNIDEPPAPVGKRFSDRLARYETWRRAQGDTRPVEVVRIEEFLPAEGERYLFGFRGVKIRPLLRDLRQRFGLWFAPIVHPTAWVSPMATLGEGVFVGAGSVVGPHAGIGAFTLLNRGVLIGHDCQIGECNVIGPGAKLASAVHSGDGAIVGIGGVVLEELTLGAGCYVAAGAVALESVPERTLVAGLPAVVKKTFPER